MEVMLSTDKILAIFVCLASVWYVFYESLQSFMTCGRSVKEFSFISYFLFIINPQRVLSAALLCIRFLSPIDIAMLLMIWST